MTGEAKLLEQMLDAVLLSADLLALREDDVLQSLDIIRERGSGTGVDRVASPARRVGFIFVERGHVADTVDRLIVNADQPIGQPDITGRGINTTLLLHRVPECLSVTPDAIIAGDEGDQLGRLTDFCRSGKVNRIERADGLDGVGTPRAHQH